jgi:hypothetical protein
MNDQRGGTSPLQGSLRLPLLESLIRDHSTVESFTPYSQILDSVSVTQSPEAGSAPNMHSTQAIWTSTADWFKPPPKSLVDRQGLGIPNVLILSVPPSERKQAAAVLATHDFLALTQEQAQHFAPGIDPDSILDSLIKEKKRKLSFFLEHPVKSNGLSASQLEQARASRESIIANLNSDIERFSKWKHHVAPFLIKGVALWEKTGAFFGTFVSGTLILHHASLGDTAAPMKNVPVVAFLPRRPQAIYTSVSMAE